MNSRFGDAFGANKTPAAVHLDLDGTPHIYRIHGWEYEKRRDPLFETGLQKALDFFDRAKVRATLFVIAEDLDDPGKRDLIKDAVMRGHEIASHSLTHRKLSSLSREDKRREIFESRERIAARIGVEAQGFRAPNFDIDRESLELVDAAGYTYDSSVFPTARFARRLGLSTLPESPHRPLEGCKLLELPLPAYAPLPLPFHPCYSMVLGAWYFRLGLRSFKRKGAPLVLLFHLADLTDPFQYDRLRGWRAKVYSLPHTSGEHKRHLCERMLELVRRDYTFVDTARLLAVCG
jgi:hypothetical protein